MSNVLETVLLLALPASGKSEVRKYLASLTPAQCADDFHMGPTVQLDDFPYVHLMRRIDDEAAARGAGRVYFQASDRPFLDPRDWGTLIELLNEDHAHLVGQRPAPAPSAALALFDRLERASAKVGFAPRLPELAPAVRAASQRASTPATRSSWPRMPGLAERRSATSRSSSSSARERA